MDIEETLGGQADTSFASGPSGQEEPQNPNGSMESTLAALSGIGGEQLSEQLQVVRESENPGATSVAERITGEEKAVDRDDNTAITSDILKDTINKSVDNQADQTAEELAAATNIPAGEVKKEGATTINSPIYGGDKAVDSGNLDIKPFEYEGSESANNFIKEKTGYDNLESLISSSLNLKENASVNSAAVQEAKGYSDLFQNMPAELYEAVNSYANGKDWKSDI